MKSELAHGFSFRDKIIQEFWCSGCEWKSDEKLTQMYSFNKTMDAYSALIVAAAFLLMLLFERSGAEPSPPADTAAL